MGGHYRLALLEAPIHTLGRHYRLPLLEATIHSLRWRWAGLLHARHIYVAIDWWLLGELRSLWCRAAFLRAFHIVPTATATLRLIYIEGPRRLAVYAIKAALFNSGPLDPGTCHIAVSASGTFRHIEVAALSQ